MSIDEFLSDPAVRSAVVTELRRMAGVAKRSGDKAWLDGRYKLAVADHLLAAQRERAADDVERGVDIDPRDLRQVHMACESVQRRMGSVLTWTAGDAR